MGGVDGFRLASRHWVAHRCRGAQAQVAGAVHVVRICRTDATVRRRARACGKRETERRRAHCRGAVEGGRGQRGREGSHVARPVSRGGEGGRGPRCECAMVRGWFDHGAMVVRVRTLGQSVEHDALCGPDSGVTVKEETFLEVLVGDRDPHKHGRGRVGVGLLHLHRAGTGTADGKGARGCVDNARTGGEGAEDGGEERLRY